jgi:hypothetical protein
MAMAVNELGEDHDEDDPDDEDMVNVAVDVAAAIQPVLDVDDDEFSNHRGGGHRIRRSLERDFERQRDEDDDDEEDDVDESCDRVRAAEILRVINPVAVWKNKSTKEGISN